MTIRCGALPPAFAIPKLAFSLQTFAKLDFFPSSRQTLHSKCAHLLLCLRVSAVMGAIAQLPACGWCRTVHFASLPKVNQRQSQRLKARTMMEASLMTSWVPLANGVSRYTTPPPPCCANPKHRHTMSLDHDRVPAGHALWCIPATRQSVRHERHHSHFPAV